MLIKNTHDLESSIYQDAVAIRTAVFVEEQGVPLELELAQEDLCEHFVGYIHAEAVATARLLPEEGGFHVQRVAVMRRNRGQGYGHALLQELRKFAGTNSASQLSLDAQLQAIPFYEKLGYQLTDKPEFLDAGMPHRRMILDLR